MKALTKLLFVTATFLTACDANQQAQISDVHEASSPWHSLTADEVTEASGAVRAKFGDKALFNRISLAEPKKSEALDWQPGNHTRRGAEIAYRLNGASYLVRYDFDSAQLSESRKVTSGQPMLVGEELFGAVEKVIALPEVIDAISQRGIDPDYALCLPRTVGRFYADIADPENDRLARFDCFNIRGQNGLGILPTTSAYARPIEGLSVLFDVEENRLIEITDSFTGSEAPPADFDVLELDEDTLHQ